MENKFPKIPAIKSVVERGLYDGTDLEISEKMDGCFTYETHIQTDTGVMCIGKIVNQRLPVNVLSYNIETGNTEYKPVVNWFKNGPTSAWLEVTFESPTKEKCIIVTPNHKVYDGVQFKPICEFAVGDVVYYNTPSPDFNNISAFTIKSIRTIIPRNPQRYDIEVADNHNYFAAGILVSNSNFSFIVEQDSTLTFRSRNRVLSGGSENGGQWSKAVDYITEAHARAPFEQDFVYFGESMTKHTLNYGVTPPFIGYAVYSRKEERFLADWEMSFASRDIPVVPTWKIPASTPHVEVMEMVNKISNETSAFGTTGTKREGVVIKNYNTQVFAKYVREEFKEENKKVFGDPKIMPKMDDTDKIVFNYCTPSRIHKHVMSLKDERGYEIGMPMMEHLPVLVEEDILTESIVDIAKRYKSVNFKMMRKHIAHYCVHYLKAMLNWEYDDDIETLHRRVTAQFYTAPRSV